MLVDDVYVTYIQFGFPIYVMYEFLNFMISSMIMLVQADIILIISS